MGDITDRDEAQWQAVRNSLAQDAEGRKILSALAQDPQAGAVALRRRLRDGGVPAITNELSNADIEKFVTLAHADQVYIGDRNTYLDQSQHYVDLELNPMARATGFARFLMVSGTLVCLGGFATILFGMYLFIQQSNSAFNAPLESGLPASVGFPPQMLIGFGVFFAGMVLLVVGNLFKPKDRRPGPR